MAAMTTMQAIPASSMAKFASKGRVSHFFTATHLPRRFPGNAGVMTVRSMAKKEDEPKEQATEPVTLPPMSELTPPNPKKGFSTNFSDVFAFSGPAPERINGRLAMIGFVAAMAVELSKGQDVFSQISEGGVQWFVGTSILFSLASLIPLFKGVSAESKSDGVMTSDAELWNGRFAMLGLVALAFTEFVKGGALV